jgi:AraC-like DNA-binding protein
MLLIDPDTTDDPVFVLSAQHAAMDGPWHSHRRVHLIYASAGVLTVESKSGKWVVPPQRGVWIPPGELHKVSAQGDVWLRTLYAESGIVSTPPTCCMVVIDRLLSELLIEASSFGTTLSGDPEKERLMQVILDRLPNLLALPFYVPKPTDPRLLRITIEFEKNPTDQRTLDALASTSGLSARTAARLFLKETGMTFGRWRQQLRLFIALQLLGLGKSVSQVAGDVGYSDVSAFITVFKDAFGETPSKYLRQD